MSIQLESLVGSHVLSGVDTGHVVVTEYGYDERCETLTFVLDGKTLTITEDPGDGYRSSMRDLVEGGVDVHNTFEPCSVVGSMRTSGEYGSVDDVLELRDIHTGKVVLEIGTENTHDYYPCFVAMFDPSAMAVNASPTHASVTP